LKNEQLHHEPNRDQTPVHSDLLSNHTDDGVVANSVITSGNEKMRVTTLSAVSDGRKLPPYIILYRTTMPMEQLPTGSTNANTNVG
jgi:hypothetical protein